MVRYVRAGHATINASGTPEPIGAILVLFWCNSNDMAVKQAHWSRRRGDADGMTSA